MPNKLDQIRIEAEALASGINAALSITRNPDSFEIARLEALIKKSEALCARLTAIEPTDSQEASDIIKPLLSQLEDAAYLLQDSLNLFSDQMKGSS